MDPENSRWACPKCGSKDVEIALPMWCTEDKDGTLAQSPEQDLSGVNYWACNTCLASDSGKPTDLLKE